MLASPHVSVNPLDALEPRAASHVPLIFESLRRTKQARNGSTSSEIAESAIESACHIHSNAEQKQDPANTSARVKHLQQDGPTHRPMASSKEF